MLNPGVLKCYADLVTLETYVQQGKTMNIKFFIYVPHVNQFTSLATWGPWGGGGGVGASIIILGPSWFTSTLLFILIYMSNMEAI